MSSSAIRIATRKSPLAKWQAAYVRDLLLTQKPDREITFLELVSAGDKTLDAPLSVAGGKGMFLKELEEAVRGGDADLAVHSMKDVTVTMPDGLIIGAICERDDARDAFVSSRFDSLANLPTNARIGTCSLRRQCQLRAKFPHLQAVNLRGNVGTRIAALDAGKFDAIVLAVAGLKRLNLQHRIAEYLSPEVCLPAVGQGAIGVQCRADDEAMREILRPLNHEDSALCVTAERAANAKLGGGCHVPLAVFAELHDARISVRGRVGSVDGVTLLCAEKSGDRDDAEAIGVAVAEDLLRQGAAKILDAVYGD